MFLEPICLESHSYMKKNILYSIIPNYCFIFKIRYSPLQLKQSYMIWRSWSKNTKYQTENYRVLYKYYTDTFPEIRGICRYLWKKMKAQHMTENLYGVIFWADILKLTSLQKEICYYNDLVYMHLWFISIYSCYRHWCWFHMSLSCGKHCHCFSINNNFSTWIFTFLLIFHIEVFPQTLCSVGISFPPFEDCLAAWDVKNISRHIFSLVSWGNKA